MAEGPGEPWQGSAAVACDGSEIPAEKEDAGGGTGAPEQGGEIPNVESVTAFLGGWTLIWFYVAKSWELKDPIHYTLCVCTIFLSSLHILY